MTNLRTLTDFEVDYLRQEAATALLETFHRAKRAYWQARLRAAEDEARDRQWERNLERFGGR